MHNTPLKVFTIPSYDDSMFDEIVEEYKPSLILYNLEPELFVKEMPFSFKMLYFTEFFSIFKTGVSIVDIVNIDVGTPILKGFLIEHDRFSLPKNMTELRHIIRQTIINNKCELNYPKPSFNSTDLRQYLCVNASIIYLSCHENNENSCDWIRCFIYYHALMRETPPQLRGITSYNVHLAEMCEQQFLNDLSTIMSFLLQVDQEQYSSVADIWHGLYFLNVMELISSNTSIENLPASKLYLSSIETVNTYLSVPLTPFPILTTLEYKPNDEIKMVSNLQEQKFLLPTTNALVILCCDIFDNTFKDKYLTIAQAREYAKECRAFFEDSLWHNHDQLIDEYCKLVKEDRIPNEPALLKLYIRMKHRLARFHMIYGKNLEGYDVKQTVIVATKNNNNNNNNKQTKKEKMSGKARKIIEDIENKKKVKVEEEEMRKLKDLDESNQKYKFTKPQLMLKQYEKISRLLQSNKSLQIVYFKRMEIFFDQWTDGCKNNKQNLDVVDDFLLTFCNLLSTGWIGDGEPVNTNGRKEKKKLKQENTLDPAKISTYLHELGFVNLANSCKLPRPKIVSGKYVVNSTFARYQLSRLGPHLDRETGGVPDLRVTSFIPDPWQTRLFDIVDRKESALIIAPTSSGKTYAMYYCIEQVLKESDDGVVVYVAPTKALVYQVTATVCARFQKSNLPPGKALFGTFTRDHRINALNSQVLITVPAILEILLMSPKLQHWVRRLRYIVFDEVHMLAKNDKGLAWERCILLSTTPFLALSATVDAPTTFQSWLQRVQDLKKEKGILAGNSRVNLVICKERHSDLKKYVYTGKELSHCHPYSFLDPITMKINKGVPESLSLSPDEVLQLYDVLKKLQIPGVENVDVEAFFNSSTEFIRRPRVREFERVLRNLVNECFKQQLNLFQDIITELSDRVVGVHKFPAEIQKDIFNLLTDLHENNMTPAIVFSYDRRLITKCATMCGQHFEDQIVNPSGRILKKDEKLEKQAKKLKEKEEKREQKKGTIDVNKLAKPNTKRTLNLLGDSPSPFRGIGVADRFDVEYIERRLINLGMSTIRPHATALRHGFGLHHGGLHSHHRSAVEMLFRMRSINCVFATGTLALGVPTPCKTVVIAGDTHYIDPLEFQQMSGRAGRRGFDTSGNVVLFGLSERRLRILLTGSLPKMSGTYPLSASFILKQLILIMQVEEEGVSVDKARMFALNRILVLLECALLYDSVPIIKLHVKYFFYFAVQFLMLSGYLDLDCNPQYFTGIITHLTHHEPGNFAFVHLYKSKIFHQLLVKADDGKISEDSLDQLMIVLNFLFARRPIIPEIVKRKELKNSIVILPAIPDIVRRSLKEYNRNTKSIFSLYYKSLSEKLPAEKSLPLSNVNIELQETTEQNINSKSGNDPNLICSVFATLSGCQDSDIYNSSIIPCMRADLFPTSVKIPIIDLDVDLNSYAYDFYKHGILKSIQEDNTIKRGDDFFLLKDFLLVVKNLRKNLAELNPNDSDDRVLNALKIIQERFETAFRNSF